MKCDTKVIIFLRIPFFQRHIQNSIRFWQMSGTAYLWILQCVFRNLFVRPDTRTNCKENKFTLATASLWVLSTPPHQYSSEGSFSNAQRNSFIGSATEDCMLRPPLSITLTFTVHLINNQFMNSPRSGRLSTMPIHFSM